MPPTTLLGSQVPRIESRPDDVVGSHGPRVLQFGRLAGVFLDPWQELLINRLFDVNSEGRSAATEFGYLVSRQNGKGEVQLLWELAHLFMFPRPDRKPKLIVHTAHEVKTAAEAFLRLQNVFDSTPRFQAKLAVNGIKTANGQEGIKLRNGNRIRFIARSKNSGRGLTMDKLVVDEAQQCPGSAYAALQYATSAVPDLQTIVAGTVPGPENDPEIFEAARDRGRAGSTPRAYWAEWNPEGSDRHDYEVADYEDQDLWAQAIPALGGRIKLPTVADQIDRATDTEELERERFSIWRDPAPKEQIRLNDVDPQTWEESTREDAELQPPCVLSVQLGRSGGYSTISAASRTEDDKILVRHLRTDRQTLWVPEALRDFRDELGARLIVIDSKNCAPIMSDLDREGIKYLPMNATEIAGAFDLMIESINAGEVVHRGQEELTISLRHAMPRKVGNLGFTWEQSDPSEPATQIQSATNAHWGVKKMEAHKPRDGVVRGYGG